MRSRSLFFSCLLMLLLLTVAQPVFAQPMSQDSRMAERYFGNGEFEKAAIHYKKLYYDRDGVEFWYDRYFETLVKIGDYEELDKMIRRAYKQSDNDVNYLVDLGYVYSMQGDEKAAAGYYEQAIDALPAQHFAISNLAAKFIRVNELKYAERTYKSGRELLNDASLFNFELGYIYSAEGRYDDLIGVYLEELYFRPDRIQTVQSSLQRYLDDDQFELLEAVLLKRVQKEPRVLAYQELLIWMYMQMDDYDMAFIQARSVDIQFGGNGRRILELARVAAQQEVYDVSIKAYQYLVDQGPELDIFITASLELINVKRDKIVHTPYYTEGDLRSLERSYRDFLEKHHQDYTAGYATLELAKLEAFYLHQIDTAVGLLADMLSWPRLNRDLEADAKLDLGDYYLLKGEHWESTLLYGQVEKAFRGTPVAEDAKLRNARLSYYKGDFEWAKTQLDILKASTSELISNNAIELSVFIADNLNLDTTDHPMILFARADLLLYQNRLDEAERELDGILELYPFHTLTDDIYYKKAEIALRRQQYDAAIGWLDKIIEDPRQDLLTDNALYLKGDIYLNYIHDEEKALAAFEKLVLEFQGSTFGVDARKKYRMLRGDLVN